MLQVLQNFLERISQHSAFYFLVIGAGRGGTSLLAGLLDSHPLLEMEFEKFAHEYLMGNSVPADKDTAEMRVNLFLRACKKERKTARYWGNKITTEQIYSLSQAKQANDTSWEQVFIGKVLKERKIVYVIRDGRSCVRSKMERTGQSYEEALRRWKFSVKFYQLLQRSDVALCKVNFEDLVRQPETELRRICDFLGLSYNNAMLQGTANHKMKPEYRQEGFDTSTTGLEKIPLQWERDMRTELEELGYI